MAASRVGNDDTYTLWTLLDHNPQGNIMAEAGETEEIITTTLDFALLPDVRKQLPLLKNRRPELYANLRKQLNI